MIKNSKDGFRLMSQEAVAAVAAKAVAAGAAAAAAVARILIQKKFIEFTIDEKI